MRVYANGTVSNGEKANFLLTDLCFAAEEWNDPTVSGDNCLILSGQLCETSSENKEWSSRWKGVDVSFGDEGHNDYTAEKIGCSAQKILDILIEKKMFLRNCEAYIDFEDSSEYVKVDAVTIVDNNSEVKIPKELLEEEIEFIRF